MISLHKQLFQWDPLLRTVHWNLFEHSADCISQRNITQNKRDKMNCCPPFYSHARQLLLMESIHMWLKRL